MSMSLTYSGPSVTGLINLSIILLLSEHGITDDYKTKSEQCSSECLLCGAEALLVGEYQWAVYWRKLHMPGPTGKKCNLCRITKFIDLGRALAVANMDELLLRQPFAEMAFKKRKNNGPFS